MYILSVSLGETGDRAAGHLLPPTALPPHHGGEPGPRPAA